MARKPWTKEDIIVAYALYCVTPTNKINPSNKTLQQVAAVMDRSLPSLVMRMRNFQNLDAAGSSGMSHVAKADKEIFSEFQNDWGELSYQAESITGLDLFDETPSKGSRAISSITEKNKVSRERHFFKASVAAAYESKCCVTGMELPTFLVASHIKPYNRCRSASERTDPRNGLLLSTFYDRAFDQGLFTIDKDLRIRISGIVKEHIGNAFIHDWLLALDGSTISRARTFPPIPEYIEYHNDMIFKG